MKSLFERNMANESNALLGYCDQCRGEEDDSYQVTKGKATKDVCKKCKEKMKKDGWTVTNDDTDDSDEK